MTKPSRGSSLIQPRDSHSHSHSHSHVHSLFHRLRHGPFRPRDLPEGQLSRTDGPVSDNEVGGESDLDSVHDSLTKRHLVPAIEEVVAEVIGGVADSFITRVVQTVSLVQYVDELGLPFKTQLVFAAPNTHVFDPKTQNTAASSTSTPPSAALPGSTPGGSTPGGSTPGGSTPSGSSHASSSSSNTIHTSDNTKVATVAPSHTSHTTISPFPTVSDIRNATTCKLLQNIPRPRHMAPVLTVHVIAICHSNTSSTASTNANGSSMYAQNLYSGTVSLSTSDLYSTTSSQSHTTTNRATSTNRAATTNAVPSISTSTTTSTITIASTSRTKIKTTIATSSTTDQSSYSTSSSSSPDDGYGTLTVAGSLPKSTFSGNDGNDGDGGGRGAINLTQQQKQVIGGVVGSVAGIALIGLLFMLFLRYKKRKGGVFLLGSQSGTPTARSLGEVKSGGGSGAAMAESAAASGAVASALATLTGKKPSLAPPSTAGEERGFYRVSGRKLPSVLHSGGDGYSDPRASATSGSSDYYRGSQAFEPGSTGAGQLALGAPMRPVSGFPVMRSGPARVAVTENPFLDPEPPITPTTLSTRTLGSHNSPRASGSRFFEEI
ncbi:hypothetical protein E4U41_003343 [Claviceps citrina]|nr:hypothetical protein E4U41_003343 [Claviceps citrina]